MRKATPLPSQQELQEWFDYRDGNLYWKKTNAYCVKVGDKTGCVKKGKQYVHLQFKLKKYLIHRFIWAWHGNSLEPNEEIDHIDGNSFNNCIENLRPTSRKQNSENRKTANKDSKNGVKGVCFDKKAKKWRAYICHNGKHIHLGYYVNKEDAIAARIAAEKKYFTHAPDRDNELVKKPSGILSFI